MRWSCPARTGASAWRRWISPPRSEGAPRGAATSALDTAVRFLAQRPRSEYEVRRRLRRAGVEDAAIDTVLEQLRRHGLLDDGAFAEYWVEQRQSFRPRGRRLLRAELAKLGVARAAADTATLAVEPGAEDAAYRAVARYAARLGALDEHAFGARVSQWLARRGFDWETIASVTARLLAERAVQ